MRYATGDKQLIKEINRSSILKLIRDREFISRAEIAKTLKLTPATISSGISDLIEQGIIKEAGFGDSSGGRKPMLVTLNQNGMFFIGVDIHKDGVTAALVNIKGKVIQKVEHRFRGDVPSLHDHVNKAIHEVRAICQVESEKIYGIGIGMHGVVDINREIAVFIPAMAAHNVSVKPCVEKEQGLPVIIDNDANAMAVGERWFGNAPKSGNFIFVTAGVGIGAGIMFDGEIYYGRNFTAGEIGHIRVCEDGDRCVCGRYGCLDTVATEHILIKNIRQQLQSGLKSLITDLVDGDLERVNLDVIIQGAELGDRCAIDTLANAGKYIGRALSYAINLLNPDSIVLGGSLSKAGDFVLQPLIEAAKNASMPESIQDVSILCSATGENSGIIGAATMVIKQYFEEVVKI